MEIETSRLILRPPSWHDIPHIFQILGDSDAMKFTQGSTTLSACNRRVTAYENRRQTDGFAPWAILTKIDRRIIGWGGLYTDPFKLGWGPEISCLLAPDMWGQGFASEIVRAALRLADHNLILPEVRAFAHKDNSASRRVLEKSGFTNDRYVPELGRLLYRRKRNTRLLTLVPR